MILFDATASTTGLAVSSLTFSHTNAGNLLVVTSVAEEPTASAADLVITGITYNAVALTKVRADQGTDAGSNTDRVEIWYLLNPSHGASNVIITYTGTIAGCGGMSTSYKAARIALQTIESSNTATGSDTAPTVSVTPVNASTVLVSVVLGVASTVSIDAFGTQTNRQNLTVTGVLRGAMSDKFIGNPASTVCGYTLSAGNVWFESAASFASDNTAGFEEKITLRPRVFAPGIAR